MKNQTMVLELDLTENMHARVIILEEWITFYATGIINWHSLVQNSGDITNGQKREVMDVPVRPKYVFVLSPLKC